MISLGYLIHLIHLFYLPKNQAKILPPKSLPAIGLAPPLVGRENIHPWRYAMLRLTPLSLLALLACTADTSPVYVPDDDTGTPPVIETDGDGDGWSVEDGDCDDADPAIYPGAVEICDGLDNDCSGEADDVVDNVWYLDSDGDGFGGSISLLDGCEVDSTSAWVGSSDDCDDDNADVNPDATEVCNGLDDDCDGTVDPDDSADATVWFADEDEDGFGDNDNYATACSQPSGYVGDWSDCNDANPLVNPGQAEVCDELDNDCDSVVDEADGNTDVLTLWDDDDGDGFGDNDAGSFVACPADGFVNQGGDCDDTDGSVNPDATEVCDSLDNDCDDDTDEDDAADAAIWYTDADSDGFGDSSSSSVSCSAPSGWVSDNSDCDDSDAGINPGATEVCNSVDDDCDGDTDPSTSADAGTWYVDSDGDSYGDSSSSSFVSCDAPEGYVADATDCDDADATSYPGATEYCDGADNDCDGSTDPDDSVDATSWYDDNDEDGWGDSASSSVSCSAPSGTVADATDCDDTDSSVYPDAIEVCADGVDNDCDGDTDSSPCVTEGSYEGDFTITLTETTYGLGSDSCEGTATLTVDTTADPMISGTVECEFVGDASAYFPDTYSGTVEGDFDTDLLPSGTIDWATFGWSFDWTDDGSGDTNVDGTFSGSDTYLGFGFDYTGDFATDYTP